MWKARLAAGGQSAYNYKQGIYGSGGLFAGRLGPDRKGLLYPFWSLPFYSIYIGILKGGKNTLAWTSPGLCVGIVSKSTVQRHILIGSRPKHKRRTGGGRDDLVNYVLPPSKQEPLIWWRSMSLWQLAVPHLHNPFGVLNLGALGPALALHGHLFPGSLAKSA